MPCDEPKNVKFKEEEKDNEEENKQNELDMLKDVAVKKAGSPAEMEDGPSDKNANISGGKGTDKKEEGARAPNRGNKPSANVKGKRA